MYIYSYMVLMRFTYNLERKEGKELPQWLPNGCSAVMANYFARDEVKTHSPETPTLGPALE